MICQNEKICQQDTKVIISKPNKQSALQQFSYRLKKNIDSFEEDFYQPDYEFENTENQVILPCNSQGCYSSSNSSETEIQVTQPKIQKSIFYHKYNKNMIDDQTSFQNQLTQISNQRSCQVQVDSQIKYTKKITNKKNIIFDDQTNNYIKKNTLRNIQYIKVDFKNPQQYWNQINN